MRAILTALLLAGLLLARDQPKTPQTLKEVLLEQLHSTHDRKDWFVPTNVAVEGLTPQAPEAAVTAPAAVADPAGSVVLDYCTAVRGILNDDQGGPLHPPGVRMAEALTEVHASLRRNLDEKKGDSRRSNSAAWPDASRGASTRSRSSKRSSEDTSR